MVISPCRHCGTRNVTRIPPNARKPIQRRCEVCTKAYWIAHGQEFPCAIPAGMVHVTRSGMPKLTEERKAAFSEIGDHRHEQDTGVGKCGQILHSPIVRL
jgi:hypothetical protein